MQQILSYDTLGELDQGTARLIIDAAIREAVADCDDRGDDGKPRSVEIKLIVQRMENGLIETSVQARAVMPARRTHSTVAKLKQARDKGAQLTFQDLDSSDPSQRTIDEAIDRNKE